MPRCQYFMRCSACQMLYSPMGAPYRVCSVPAARYPAPSSVCKQHVKQEPQQCTQRDCCSKLSEFMLETLVPDHRGASLEPSAHRRMPALLCDNCSTEGHVEQLHTRGAISSTPHLLSESILDASYVHRRASKGQTPHKQGANAAQAKGNRRDTSYVTLRNRQA
jgi:hypothetical protein